MNEPFMQDVTASRKPVYVNVNPGRVEEGNLYRELEVLWDHEYEYAGEEIIDGVTLWKLVPSR